MEESRYGDRRRASFKGGPLFQGLPASGLEGFRPLGTVRRCAILCRCCVTACNCVAWHGPSHLSDYQSDHRGVMPAGGPLATEARRDGAFL